MNSDVKKFYKITPEQIENAQKILVTDGVKIINDLFRQLISDQIAVVKDNCVYAYYDVVAMSVVTTEVPRIGAIQERPAYAIHTVDLNSELEIGVYHSMPEAAMNFVKEVFRLKCNECMQDFYDQELANEGY